MKVAFVCVWVVKPYEPLRLKHQYVICGMKVAFGCVTWVVKPYELLCHATYECPTSHGIRIKCTYCGGNHSVNECWNLRRQCLINQIKDNMNPLWQEEQIGPRPNSN